MVLLASRVQQALMRSLLVVREGRRKKDWPR
jgi:hypothetical protein